MAGRSSNISQSLLRKTKVSCGLALPNLRNYYWATTLRVMHYLLQASLFSTQSLLVFHQDTLRTGSLRDVWWDELLDWNFPYPIYYIKHALWPRPGIHPAVIDGCVGLWMSNDQSPTFHQLLPGFLLSWLHLSFYNPDTEISPVEFLLMCQFGLNHISFAALSFSGCCWIPSRGHDNKQLPGQRQSL